MFQQRNDVEKNNWIVGSVRRVEGYPVPVAGLIAPHGGDDGRAVLQIGQSTSMYVRRTEIASRHQTFATWYRANAYTGIGRAVEAAMPAGDPIDLYAYLAALDYCLAAKLHIRQDIERATRIVVAAHNDLRRQVAMANTKVAH